ncbi:hypothetical protein [Candidatus Ichthyocystis sparus]|uniref:hypothetical protein n=1 Tax=Candidatus Ichthyocystis sparus TaxID=1561004 RepID=UPI000B81F9E8|nr:hypothetical protein [Candidatus Ichthyocystis sparus]
MNRGRFSIFGKDSVHIGGVDGDFDVPSTSVKRVRFLCDVTETAVTESAASEAAVRSEEERAKAIYDLRVESFLDNSSCSFSAVIRATRPKPIMGIAAKVRAIGHGSLVGAVAKVAKSEHSEVGVVGSVRKRSSPCSVPRGILLTGSSYSSVHHPLLTLSDHGSSAGSYDVAKSEYGEVGGVVGSVRKRSSPCSVPRGILRSGSTCSSVAMSSDQSARGGNSGGSYVNESPGGSDTGVGGGNNKGVIWIPRYRRILGLSLKDYVKSGGDSSSVSVSSDQSARGGNPGGSSAPEAVAEVSANVGSTVVPKSFLSSGRGRW